MESSPTRGKDGLSRRRKSRVSSLNWKIESVSDDGENGDSREFCPWDCIADESTSAWLSSAPLAQYGDCTLDAKPAAMFPFSTKSVCTPASHSSTPVFAPKFEPSNSATLLSRSLRYATGMVMLSPDLRDLAGRHSAPLRRHSPQVGFA